VSCRQIAPSGCDSTMKLQLIINQKPAPAINGTINVCEGSDINYTVTTNPGSSYSWSASGGTITGSSNSPVISVHWDTSGSGSVNVTETNSTGCSVTSTLPVNIMSRPAPDITGNNSGCLGLNGIYTTIWTPSSNFIWTVSGGAIVSGNGTNVISVNWFTTGSAVITLTVVNTSTGCDSTVTLNVDVLAITTPVIQASDFSGCVPFAVQFTGNIPSAGQTYQWSFGDALTSSGSNPTHIYYTPGTYTVMLITQNPGGCSDTAYATVNAYPPPSASFTHNYVGIDYYVGEGLLDLDNTSTGGSTYMWTFGTGDTSNVFEPLYTYQNAGNYPIILYVTSAYGCTDSTIGSIHVRLHENLYIPNAFSPNNNDLNDYFSIVAENIKTLNIIIFDRWGEIIYTSNDKYFKWDGTYNGDRVQQGIYGYIITAKGYTGDENTYKGTLTVVK
ncbi:MAG TPA: PKD domain-containing protein, partial [Bacteroidia bacterium]|nr:PKD domain-containing protein [Bacteroidia bacterium]